MPNDKRLIEVAFPLKQASLDSVHEKNVRHGHISTLHIWPARRPLAASRAALIATLLPDPGDPEKRKEILERMAGKVVKKIERKKIGGRTIENVKETTEGGILHWGRENGPDLQWFRDEIRKAYGGRAPKVLDPFAGGGAIPLEAMRLGCEATAIDINPVAWFILKCTLEYPQKLAGQTRPLPDFIRQDAEFMESFLKAKGFSGVQLRSEMQRLGHGSKDNVQLEGLRSEDPVLQADLAWHVRAWGRWVLAKARKELAPYYPTYADFEPLNPEAPYEPRPMQLVPLKEDGTADIDSLNVEFKADYLKDKDNPRWVAKSTVAYLWARTVKCKQCRATVPLLKTRWLAKKDNKRVLLTMEPNKERTGVVFGIETDVPFVGGNAAQRRENDKRVGAGTMSRAGAKCLCCGLPSMSMSDIRAECGADRSSVQLLAVVTEGVKSKEYRNPTDVELKSAEDIRKLEPDVLANLSGHSLDEPFNPESTRSISAQLYGVRKWKDLYTPRQLVGIGTLGVHLRNAWSHDSLAEIPEDWRIAIVDAISLSLDRLACFMCVNTRWKVDADSLTDAFSRFSISLLWDFAEANPLGTAAGAFARCFERIATAYDGLLAGIKSPETVLVTNKSAGEFESSTKYDLILTDPPYYQAVSYADLSDFFYTWLRGFTARELPQFSRTLTEKINEFVQHIRGDKSREIEKKKYESQMSEAFRRSRQALSDNGLFVCVFAHKDPMAWETLVSAIINSGFVVVGSWPVQTEMPSRQRGAGVAALSSSVWLVCRPRLATARPGWDNQVLMEMRDNIAVKLRDFWDAGIRGPDFVWAATGPALESYSRHPVVKKADDPGQVMGVTEFLREVRRIVVDFVVGRVLSKEQIEVDMAAAESLDDVTTYYLLHRHDFNMEDAPIGACILYALSCNLSDAALVDQWDILARRGATSAVAEDEEAEDEPDEDSGDDDGGGGGGAKVRLKAWNQRTGKSLGMEAPSGRPVPLIDQAHKLMHLWRAGDAVKVDDYLEKRGLKRSMLFAQMLQALIELAPGGSEERSVLESLSNHMVARGGIMAPRQMDHLERGV